MLTIVPSMMTKEMANEMKRSPTHRVDVDAAIGNLPGLRTHRMQEWMLLRDTTRVAQSSFNQAPRSAANLECPVVGDYVTVMIPHPSIQPFEGP